MSETISELGKILTGEHGRDAIHIAVAPAVAVTVLAPGDHVGLVDGGVGPCEKPIGIVDPFLKTRVTPGQQFWLFLYPMTITSLRHEWTHPAFAGAVAASPEADSRRWIEAFAAANDKTYAQMMRAGSLWVEDEEYTYDNSEAYKDGPYYEQIGEFWKHYEIVTGTKVKDHKATFFTCSC